MRAKTMTRLMSPDELGNGLEIFIIIIIDRCLNHQAMNCSRTDDKMEVSLAIRYDILNYNLRQAEACVAACNAVIDGINGRYPSRIGAPMCIQCMGEQGRLPAMVLPSCLAIIISRFAKYHTFKQNAYHYTFCYARSFRRFTWADKCSFAQPLTPALARALFNHAANRFHASRTSAGHAHTGMVLTHKLCNLAAAAS